MLPRWYTVWLKGKGICTLVIALKQQNMHMSSSNYKDNEYYQCWERPSQAHMNKLGPRKVLYQEINSHNSLGRTFHLVNVIFFCSGLNVNSFAVLKPMHQWPSKLSLACYISDYTRRALHAAIAAGSERQRQLQSGHGAYSLLQRAESVHSVSSLSKYWTTWAWCTCCLFLETLNPVFVSFLVVNYLSFNIATFILHSIL